ncbi:DUF6230 family protein [Paractinoplanes rishiriensis]|uniref:Cholesterol esterase n=1 Tax=Paractinoplanes rishiriensis TaxID=1050105 RepID=A0A919MU71_9ACTN|nr:DUF6230 family protein [Actinoplanes rishiriensis]GIE95019.1 cholesterol esterase [Actinoplanes rishiriensis]
MKDALGDPAYGRTNWRRFAIAAGVPAVVAGGLVFGVASGALAASFSVSGKQFKLSADRLEGTGFTQYAGELETVDGKIPAAKSGIGEATLTNLCQTVAAGPLVLRIEAGKDADNPVEASDLLIGMSELSGDAEFTNIDIGQDASTLSKDGLPEHGAAKSFGQQADKVVITNLRQIAYSTSASTFKLKGMSLKLHVGTGKECF